MTITLDTVAAALASPACPKNFRKSSAAAEGLASWHSLWKVTGEPTAGANPPLYTAGSGYVPTTATTGAIGQANPAGGNNKYIASLTANNTVTGQLVLYDRLWACSGLTTNAVTTLNVTTPGTLTAGRDPNTGFDVEPWLEIYTAPGATAGLWTLTGTDSTGTAGRTWTYAHPANAETIGQMAPFVQGTAIGGCRVVTSLGFSIASGTAGDVGITLLRRLASVSVLSNNLEAYKDMFALGMPIVYNDACLAFMMQCTTTTTGIWIGQVSIPELTP